MKKEDRVYELEKSIPIIKDQARKQAVKEVLGNLKSRIYETRYENYGVVDYMVMIVELAKEFGVEL